MKRTAGRILLTTLLAALCAAAARAQETAAVAGAWVSVAPADESFVVWMPKPPAVTEQHLKIGEQAASARLYAALGDDSTNYRVWSFADPRPPAAQTFRYSEHFDELAELAWKLLARKKWEKTGYPRARAPMAYRGELYVADFGREYRLNLAKARGLVDIYAVGSRVYIVAADGPAAADSHLEPFLDSFGIKVAGGGGVETLLLRNGGRPPRVAELSRAAESSGLGVGMGRGVNTGGDLAASTAAGPDRPFAAREVARKAVITRRPEPSYTESARKFYVAGVVKLRLLLASDGSVRNISVVRALPHGLTGAAIEAARRVRFEPAEKDGRKVSQFIVIEYSFNVY